MSNSNKYAVFRFGVELARYRESFNELGPDEYHPTEAGGRTRRFAQYHATYDPKEKVTEVAKLITQPFIQKETNKLVGHIARRFETVNVDLSPHIEKGFRLIDTNWGLSEYKNEWLVHCHQIRVHARPCLNGIAVPEGIHQDGAELVLMSCVAREGVSGGISLIYEQPDMPPVYGVTLMPGDSILVDDRQVFHTVSPLIAGAEHGYRDMILMGLHLWSHGKYRGDWRKSIAEVGAP